MKLNVRKTLKNHIKENNPNYKLFAKESEDFLNIELRKIIKQKNKKKRVSNQPSKLKTRKYIDVDEKFIEWLGLWFGDGIRSRVGISNNELYLIKFYLDSIEKYFNYKRNNFTLSIYTNSKDKNKINKKKILKELNLPESCFRKIYIDERCTKSLFYIEKFNRCFVVLIESVFSYMLPAINSDKSYTIPFLRGVFAAEGSVTIIKQKSGAYKRYITISGDKQSRIFYKELLRKVGVKAIYEYGRQISISNQHDIIKLNRLKITNLHPTKHKKFVKLVKGYKEFHRRKGETQHLATEFLREIGCAKTLEVAEQLNFTNDSAFVYLNRLKNKGVIKHSKICRSWLWFLSDTNIKNAFKKRLESKYYFVIEAFRELKEASPHDIRKFLLSKKINVWNQIYYIIDWLLEAELIKPIKEE